MGYMLAGIKVAMLGGDQREFVLLKELLSLGANVQACGLPKLELQEGYQHYDNPVEAVKGVNVIILPVRGVNTEGQIYTPDNQQKFYFNEKLIKSIPAGTVILVGVANSFLKELAATYGWQLTETANLDEMAVLNSVPTAEGAIMIAMQKLPVTLHGSEAFVLGLGRVGFTLARMLDGLGARVTVIDRGKADRARANTEGWAAYSFNDMPSVINKADVIFNTVPHQVLTKSILANTKPEVVIIDLASAPGGTDFYAAETLKRQSVLALGLPGKVAPKTAGLILARIYPSLIMKCMERQ
ncbi:MAG: dipicolinate synthase subunit [Clostridia bacterium]|nr:dipicolinate synthase subunit [Clostridia bacterium]